MALLGSVRGQTLFPLRYFYCRYGHRPCSGAGLKPAPTVDAGYNTGACYSAGKKSSDSENPGYGKSGGSREQGLYCTLIHATMSFIVAGNGVEAPQQMKTAAECRDSAARYLHVKCVR